MRFCDGAKERTKPEKGKPKTHPQKPRAGHPPRDCEPFWHRGLCSRIDFPERKEPSKSSGPPAQLRQMNERQELRFFRINETILSIRSLLCTLSTDGRRNGK